MSLNSWRIPMPFKFFGFRHGKGKIGKSHCDTEIESKNKCTFSWTIEQYSRLIERGEQEFKSSTFSVVGDRLKWRLGHKYCRSCSECSECVSYCLYPEFKTDFKKYGHVSGNVEISVMTHDRGEVIISRKIPLSLDYAAGRTTCALISVSVDEMKTYTFLDKLTIICKLTYVKNNDMVNISLHPSSESRLLIDLEQLFNDDRFKDVTFSVKGKKYTGHKTILSARSSVFNTMLRSEMRESKENEIVITDIEPRIFDKMLQYIYTGKVKNLPESVYELLPVADKYDLEELKVMCEDVLLKKLSADNAAAILKLADMHNAEMLKARTLRFMKSNKNTEVGNNFRGSDALNFLGHVVGFFCEIIAFGMSH
ncbi:speckle-type POZ protein-like isoform X1 [Planococcus citri]|uniref:speckle-type POZ protein-like isoform X1 n=1 Tax=Planococcus citri TaxID=170843 RepID=UPI0031F74A09